MATRLRSSRIEEASRGSDQIAALFDTIGKKEQIRQQRQQLDRVSSLVATAQQEGRSPSISEILSTLNQPAQFDSGFGGILQNIGSRFQPQGGGFGDQIKGGIVSDALRRALQPAGSSEPPPGLELSGERRGPGGQVTGRSFARKREGTAKEDQLFKDKDILTSSRTQFQKDKARERLDSDETRIIQPSDLTDKDFKKMLKSKDKVGGRFGLKAYRNALSAAMDEARQQDQDPKQAEQQFNAWWDDRVKSERGGFLGIRGAIHRNDTVPREQFEDGATNLNEDPVGDAAAIPELDQSTAFQLLQEAGGDKEKARKLAKERGFKL